MWSSITCFRFFIVKAEIILYFREIFSNIPHILGPSGWIMVPAPEPVNDKANGHCKLLKTTQH